MAKLTDQPEVNVALFAFLLNFPWEFLQAPLYAGMADAPHWQAIRTCMRATIGDVVIMLVAYWLVAAGTRTRWWVLKPSVAQLVGFAAAGVIITIVIEHFAVRSIFADWGWQYATTMPVVPVVGTGIAPLLQWLLLPLVAAWFVKRQLSHVGLPGRAPNQ